MHVPKDGELLGDGAVYFKYKDDGTPFNALDEAINILENVYIHRRDDKDPISISKKHFNRVLRKLFKVSTEYNRLKFEETNRLRREKENKKEKI